MTVASLRRLRWAVRATLALGVAVSVTANVLHARHNPIAQAIAAWPPLALLITVDLVSRVPIHRRLLGAVRITATFAIAAIAAFVSYGHMAGVTARYGETGLVPYLLPLSVDGLVIVASVSLVELAGRLRDSTPTTGPGPAVDASHLSPAEGPHRIQGQLGHEDTEADDETRPSDQYGPDAPGPDLAEPDPPCDLERASNGPTVAPPILAADLVPLLDAARQARDELLGEGRTVTRDALATRLRANGHPIRTTRVAELLAALKSEPTQANGRRAVEPDLP